MKELTASEYVFLKWLQERHPQLYAEAEMRQQSIGGFMDSLNTVFTNIANATPDLLNQYVKSKQDLAILKANLKRAQEGNVPINAAGQMYPAYPGESGGMSSVPQWLWITLGLGAVYLLVGKR